MADGQPARTPSIPPGLSEDFRILMDWMDRRILYAETSFAGQVKALEEQRRQDRKDVEELRLSIVRCQTEHHTREEAEEKLESIDDRRGGVIRQWAVPLVCSLVSSVLAAVFTVLIRK